MTAADRPAPARPTPAVLRRARRLAARKLPGSAGRARRNEPPHEAAALLGPAGARCVVIEDPRHPDGRPSGCARPAPSRSWS